MKSTPPRILIAPLNWGLGHATRCVPIIRELISQGCEVVIGANGAAAILLRQEFPALQHLTTPGREIRYAKKGVGFALSLLTQLPSLFWQIRAEKKWIRSVAEELKPQLIIADNCYGLHHPNIPSVLITHQLFIPTGMGKLANGLLRSFLYRLIGKFKEVWVPDYEGPVSLGGELSHPVIKPRVPLYYIGPLNRFSEALDNKNVSTAGADPEILILLSGPEPQRSILESIVKKQLTGVNRKVCLLRGLPGMNQSEAAQVNNLNNRSFTDQQLPLFYGSSHITILDHLPAKELQEKIMHADTILCRSGYTSLMEIVSLHKKLILIPTPGQPEQNYLANYFARNGYAIAVQQHELNLTKVLEESDSFSSTFPAIPTSASMTVLQQRLNYYLRSLP